MKKTALLVSLMIFAAGLSSCGNDDRGSGTGHMYDAALLENPRSLDPQFADDPSSNTVIKNLYSGLMQTDSSGSVICCNAESYDVSMDGTVYTFALRRDNYWFFDENDDDIIDDEECFPVTAKDYVFALQRVIDPQMKSPYSYDFSCIKGAANIAHGLEPAASAEIYAPDDYTLVVVLEQPNAEFLGLMATAAAYPCNKEFFESTRGRYGLDDRSVMSNGAFYVRQWFYDPYGSNNILYMRRNEKNWCDSFDIAPSYLSFSIERSEEDIRQLFKSEEVECLTSMSSSPYNPKKYIIEGHAATTLGLIFNLGDKYYANENMRRALSLAIDRESLAEQLDGDVSAASGVIPPAVKLYGRSYRELVSDKQFAQYDRSGALEYYNTAKSELGTQSVENVKILVNAETVDSSYLHILSQSWQDIFGSYIGIEDVTAEEFDRRIAEGDYSIALYPVRGRIGSGLSVVEQFENTPCLQPAAPEEKLSTGLMRCGSADELVGQYRSAEQQLLENCSFIPLFYKNSYLIADKDNEQIVFDPFTGAVDYRQALNYD